MWLLLFSERKTINNKSIITQIFRRLSCGFFCIRGFKMDEIKILQSNLESLQKKSPFEPKLALVLGSGLGGIIGEENIVSQIDYSKLNGFPCSTVEGHRGRFVFALLNGVPVIAMQGRVHLYEGYSPVEVVRGVRLMLMLGAETLVLTNAAGGIDKALSPGDIMLITDHISSFVPSPLIGENIARLGPRFPDMSQVYSDRLSDIARSCAERLGVKLKSGVYLQTTGPNYETPAEIRMYAAVGASAVGMSTAVEAMAAAHMGASVLGLSLITNHAAGITKARLCHEDVRLAAQSSGELLSALVKEIIREAYKND